MKETLAVPLCLSTTFHPTSIPYPSRHSGSPHSNAPPRSSRRTSGANSGNKSLNKADFKIRFATKNHISKKKNLKVGLDAFTKLRKAIINFVTPVCPSVHMEQLGYHWRDFHEIWNLSIFKKICRENSSALKSAKHNGYFTLRPMNTYCTVSLNSSENEECLRQNCRENTNILCPYINTLRTGLLNCLNARSRSLTFRHRASCI